MPQQPAGMNPLRHHAVLACLAALMTFAAAALVPAPAARGQFEPPIFDDDNDFGGVYIDADGMVRPRAADAKGKAADVRAKAKGEAGGRKAVARGGKVEGAGGGMVYVSLPRLFAEVRSHREAGKDVPEELRFLGGMTRLRYVLVYPEEKDLVIAGEAEPWTATGPLQAVGQTTGRPVMHLDDLVVALRSAGRPFGCSLDPDKNSAQKAQQVAVQYARKSRKARLEALREALGPQQVRVFGTAADTRTALVCVAADYRLKRFGMGIDKPPVPGLGHAIDNSRGAVNRLWFEAAYEPLLASRDGLAFEVRGPRLRVQAGAFSFDPRGSTEKAKRFADGFSAKIADVAAAVPAIAELQNVADLSLLAALIHKDGLDRKVGWDTSWTRSDTDGAYPLTRIPVPRTAETLVASTSGSLVAGGVRLESAPFIEDNTRRADQANTLTGPYREAGARRGAARDAAILPPVRDTGAASR